MNLGLDVILLNHIFHIFLRIFQVLLVLLRLLFLMEALFYIQDTLNNPRIVSLFCLFLIALVFHNLDILCLFQY